MCLFYPAPSHPSKSGRSDEKRSPKHLHSRCPPSDVCWFISPIKYRYIYHKSIRNEGCGPNNTRWCPSSLAFSWGSHNSNFTTGFMVDIPNYTHTRTYIYVYTMQIYIYICYITIYIYRYTYVYVQPFK